MEMLTVAAGLITLVCEVARDYGLEPGALRERAGLAALSLSNPDALVPRRAFYALLQHLLEQSGDPALGLRLARSFDLRRQGFWGYAVLSSMTFEERVACYSRYQAQRLPMRFDMHIDADRLLFDVHSDGVPAELLTLSLDWGFASVCENHAKRVGRADPQMQLWRTDREQPHHRELRRIVGGPVVFEAPIDRLQLMAADLALSLHGDPHLHRLALGQLPDPSQGQHDHAQVEDVLDRVRESIRARLQFDATLEGAARDLGLSARTLRRRLEQRGQSFQALLDEARRERALHEVGHGVAAFERIAAALGYADGSNFRRAFRRWTGLSPHAYRDAQRDPGRR